VSGTNLPEEEIPPERRGEGPEGSWRCGAFSTLVLEELIGVRRPVRRRRKRAFRSRSRSPTSDEDSPSGLAGAGRRGARSQIEDSEGRRRGAAPRPPRGLSLLSLPSPPCAFLKTARSSRVGLAQTHPRRSPKRLMRLGLSVLETRKGSRKRTRKERNANVSGFCGANRRADRVDWVIRRFQSDHRSVGVDKWKTRRRVRRQRRTSLEAANPEENGRMILFAPKREREPSFFVGILFSVCTFAPGPAQTLI
jgi:hypothetical protein